MPPGAGIADLDLITLPSASEHLDFQARSRLVGTISPNNHNNLN
jgi:hypothetical protein